jgi:hypothetical protein
LIDNFALLVSHGLVLIVFWRLLKRADLDAEAPPEPDVAPPRFGQGSPD